jgi:hypothetical protein
MVLGGGQAWRSATRSRRGWEPVDEILYPRNEISGTENALGRVQQYAIILEFSEEGAEVLVVFLGGTVKDKDVVKVGEREIQVFEDLIYETEGSGGVS